MTVRASFARALEAGRWRSALPARASELWARRVRVERPVRLPPNVRVIGVGGATLGGSGKTPLVAALAARVATEVAGVRVVAHGYRSSLYTARAVSPSDDARSVGDDALMLARALRVAEVPVIAGKRRAEALAVAARGATILVADGLLQTSPTRVALSLLVVDATAPWGSGACPPTGDLRAPIESLLAATDAIVAVASEGAPEGAPLAELRALAATAGLSCYVARCALGAVDAASGRPASLSALAGRRSGLVLAIARPERVATSLATYGIHPVALRLHGDHEVPSERGEPADVDLWLTTAKCATKLRANYDGAPLVVIEQRLTLPEALVARAAFGVP